MAPMKRARGEETVQVLESASSSLRRDPKRPRLSVNDSDDEPDIVRRDNGNEANESTQARRHGGVVEEYERRRDEDVEEDSDDETAMESATQSIGRPTVVETGNTANEAGIIEEVVCENFMCHSHLRVEFGPLINFIIGHNGSGKSAVLTAITLCLGGKATTTNRGQNLKSFVKEGQENCVLTVKIKNQGGTAFRPDVYGQSIIVERHFSKSGNSSFKIKNQHKRIISTKRSELDEITDYYALQLDNPVNVLTQDMARQFLNNSSPSDKYKFFVKGVQLEQLDNDYTLVGEYLDQTAAHQENIDADCRILEQKAAKAAEKAKASDMQESLRERIRKYSRQMAWAQVEEQEELLQRFEVALKQADKKIERRKQSAIAVEEAYEEAHQALQEAENVPAQYQQELEPLREEQAEIKSRFDTQRQELFDTQSAERDIKSILDNAVQSVRRIDSEIAAERQRLEAADGGSHAAKLAEIDQAQEAFRQKGWEKEQHAAMLSSLERDKVTADDKATRAGPPVDQKRDELNRAQAKLRGLQEHRGNQMAGYNQTLPTLLRAIQSHSSFREKPIGPIGAHIQLLKPEWSSILESTLGNVLNSFVVTSKHDQNILQDAMRKNRCIYPIYIGRSDRLDTSQMEPDRLFDTILRVLRIDNDLVRNQLIINQNVEQTILIQDRREAWSTMFDGAKPRNAKVCLCFHDHARGAGIRLAAGRGGGEKTDPVRPYQNQARMKTDVEAQISMQQATIDSLKQELNNLEQEQKICREEANKCSQAVVRHRNQSKQLNHDYERAEDKIQQLKDELEQETPQDGKLDELKRQLKDAEEERDMYQDQLEQSQVERNELATKSADQKHELDGIDERVKQMEHMIQKAAKKIERLAEKRQLALRQKNEALQMIADAGADKAKIERDKQTMVEQVADFVRQASEVCPRVPVDEGESAKTIEKKLGRMHQDLARYEKEVGGDPATVYRLALEAKNAFQRAKKETEDVRNLQIKLKKSLLERHEKWIKFRSAISSRARTAFVYLLSERAFRGKMRVSHNEKTLDLYVEPEISRTRRHSSDDQGGRQTKTLSGGEKSFSTICLLLALWDAMGSPIRCLDEFDVFMDSVNRDISMKMMIQAARRSVGKQYVLITPQAMGNVDSSNDVKIIKLNDPERGQAVITPNGGLVR